MFLTVNEVIHKHVNAPCTDLLSLEAGIPCKCMFLYKLATLLKLCKYSFHDLRVPNKHTFSAHVMAFLGINSCIMHVLQILELIAHISTFMLHIMYFFVALVHVLC